MHTVNLKKVGGSVMLAVPPAILSLLNWSPRSALGIEVQDGKLVVQSQPRPKFTMEELLAASDFSNQPADQHEFVEAKSTGGELI